MKDSQKIIQLFQKYLDETITEEELNYLYVYFQVDEHEPDLDYCISEYYQKNDIDFSSIAHQADQRTADSWIAITERIQLARPLLTRSRPFYYRLAAVAASMIMLITSTIYVLHINSNSPKKATVVDVLPGGNRATLVASNGKTYTLDDHKNGIITDPTGIHYSNGQLLAQTDRSANMSLLVPRGGQYRLQLSDGTKVFLNSESTLVYPVTFTGKERSVKLIGEGYFEVAHNAKQPFIVQTRTQQVKVLGTTFNVQAYGDDHKTITTLVNGRVQINDVKNQKLLELLPNQQVTYANDQWSVYPVDTELYTAWKDGDFKFKAIPLREALQQIGRWYDLDVDYASVPSDIKIHASIRRESKLSTVLHALEKITDLKFELKGRRVSAMP